MKKNYVTNDMSMAAFLLLKGQQLVKVEKKNPYVFEFLDPDNKCEKIAIDFLSSECSKYDGYLRMLRSMIRSC